MAAPRAGFDLTLNPGAPESIESTHTASVAAENAKPAKKPENKQTKTLAQGPSADGGLPEPKPEPSPKQEAAAKAAQPVV